MVQIGNFINQRFGRDWFDRAYVMDWALITGIWVLYQLIKWSPVYESSFDPSNPLISLSHKKNQIAPVTNNLIALLVPLMTVFAWGIFQGSLHIIHHGTIGLFASRGFAGLITVVLKHSVGRLRPDFLARCKWDSVIQACTGHAKNVANGRMSFPSGHSSTAFSGMIYLSLWIAGQSAAWCFSIPKAPRSIRSSRIGILCLSLLPFFWALHVALTRLQDHRHHVEDVMAGSFIGIVSALTCYMIFWPSPFSSSSFESGVHGQPRNIYSQEKYRRVAEFELSQNTFGGEV